MNAEHDVNGTSRPEESAGAGIAARTLEEARRRLAALDDLPTADHVAVFDELHRELSGVLERLDQGGEAGGGQRG
ncbi:hypothetical protein [Allosalinactinospora lopnorensis]|uniref:hypothetical protein n=1 Tax=Allosalinactinospora lopnorensis TaxID=1352348 RepID=UPI000623E546|nr:hypothetical protein [Allosalinactinospora lopnorensis]